MRISSYIRYCLLVMLCGIILISCGDMDDTYEEFLKDGETIYTGKPSALKAFSGNKRAKIGFDLISDRKITSAKVFWKNPETIGVEPTPGQRNAGRDSVEVPIERTTGTDHIEVLIDNLKEGVYTFEVFTYDNSGNSSIRSEVIAEVFGDTYQNSISNRPLNTAVYYKQNNNPTKSLDLEWFGVGQQVAVIEVIYTNSAGVEQTAEVTKVITTPGKPGVFLDRSILADYKNATALKYRTGYLPNETAIDTFYTAYKEVATIVQNLIVRPGLYKIVARHSSKAVKVRGNSTSANAQLEQNAYDDLLTSFKWRLSYNVEGYVVLTNLGSQMDMGVSGAATTDGANIVQAAQVAATNDEWIIEAVDAQNKFLRLKNRNSNKVMEVAGASTANAVNIQQRTVNATAQHQQFELIPL